EDPAHDRVIVPVLDRLGMDRHGRHSVSPAPQSASDNHVGLYFSQPMNVRHGLVGLRSVPPGAVLSVGNYDGIHLGHRRLLELAHQARVRSGGSVAIVTFEPHPLTVLKPELAPPRLTPPAIKQALLADAGVDDYVILPP